MCTISTSCLKDFNFYQVLVELKNFEILTQKGQIFLERQKKPKISKWSDWLARRFIRKLTTCWLKKSSATPSDFYFFTSKRKKKKTKKQNGGLRRRKRQIMGNKHECNYPTSISDSLSLESLQFSSDSVVPAPSSSSALSPASWGGGGIWLKSWGQPSGQKRSIREFRNCSWYSWNLWIPVNLLVCERARKNHE